MFVSGYQQNFLLDLGLCKDKMILKGCALKTGLADNFMKFWFLKYSFQQKRLK